MSPTVRRIPFLLMLLLLSACGGGGGDAGMKPPQPPVSDGSGDAFTDRVVEAAARASEDEEPIDIDTVMLSQPEDTEPTALR